MGLVALLVAGGAARVLPVSLNCPLPLRRTQPPTLVCCFCAIAVMGVTNTKSGQLEVNLSLSGKRGGKSHLGTVLLSAVYNKGSKLDPNNYRMLAVSGTLYRLYANILRKLVTKWFVENRKVP